MYEIPFMHISVDFINMDYASFATKKKLPDHMRPTNRRLSIGFQTYTGT